MGKRDKASKEDLEALDEGNKLFKRHVPDSERRIESEIFCTECRHVHKPSDPHIEVR